LAEIFGSGNFGIGFVERAGDRVDVLVDALRLLEVPELLDVPGLAALVSTFDFVAVGADFALEVRFFFAGAAEAFDFSADAFCRKRRCTFRISVTNSSFLSPCQPGTP
jgi:hypothetical protein